MKLKVTYIVFSFSLPFALLLAALFLLGNTNRVFAANWNVNTFVDENDGDCTVNCSIRDAISLANAGDTIIIPSGTYTLNNTYGRLIVDKALTLTGNVQNDTFIKGNDAQRLFELIDSAITLQDMTLSNGTDIIDGNGGGAVYIWGASADIILDNVIISGNVSTTDGGGVFLYNGRLTIQGNSRVTSNTATLNGGGIFNRRGLLTINNIELDNNLSRQGGGIYLNRSESSLVLNGGNIHNNETTATGGNFPGGGIHVNNGTATLNGGIIQHNSSYRGGGIVVRRGSATLNGTQIYSNTATYGGGVYVAEATAVFTQTSGNITENRSIGTSFGGGGMYIYRGTVYLNGGQVLSNTAVYHGGGMQIRFGNLTVNGGQIIGNLSGARGGGIYNSGATVTVTNGLIQDNIATDGGGA